jgi:hypothetical protein
MATALPAPPEPRSKADLHATLLIELEIWLTRRLGFSCTKVFDPYRNVASTPKYIFAQHLAAWISDIPAKRQLESSAV